MKIYLEDEQYTLEYYPIVYFYIESTSELDTMMDAVRKRRGFAPLFDWDDPNIVDTGWYDLYAVVDMEKGKCIQFQATVASHGCTSDDGWDYYYGGEAPCQHSFNMSGDVEIDLDDIYRQIAELVDMEEINREGEN